MILELLKLIKGLKGQSTKLNLYEHALRTVALVSEHSIRDEVVVAALLHKAKPLLRNDKWEQCKSVMTKQHKPTHYGLKFATKVEALIDQVAPESSTDSTYDFLRKAFQECDSNAELILLASILVEVQMTKSYKVCANYIELIEELISLGRLDGSDDLIHEVRTCVLTK